MKIRPVAAVVKIIGVAKFPRIRGELKFQQATLGGPVIVRGTIFGLTPGLHGLHIHQFGNLTDDCKAAGPHFNPLNVSSKFKYLADRSIQRNDWTQKKHGDREAEERHVGDLGNIEALDIDHPVSDTVAEMYLVDRVISLSTISQRGVLFRSVVVHEKPDDLGLGDHAESSKTGNSGGRIACGIIKLT